MSYQTFADSKGSSHSENKFQKIRLGDLKGKTVLDLGCNEGYFCQKAIEAGAKKVVGIDQSQHFIDKAKKRFSNIDFRCQGWDVLPEGKFDVIIFLSAIHYEHDQFDLLKRIKQALKPDGKLILECGVIDGEDAKWARVHRKVGSVLYPTRKMLLEYLLKDFAVRDFGESVMQPGDPVSRYVFHATPKQRSIVLLTGKSHSGKTNLSMMLRKNSAVISMDEHIQDMMRYEKNDLTELLRVDFSRYQLLKTYQKINNSAYVAQYCDSILESMPTDDLIFIEGRGLSLPNIYKTLISAAKRDNFRIWGMGRL